MPQRSLHLRVLISVISDVKTTLKSVGKAALAGAAILGMGAVMVGLPVVAAAVGGAMIVSTATTALSLTGTFRRGILLFCCCFLRLGKSDKFVRLRSGIMLVPSGSATVTNSFVVVTASNTYEFICPSETCYWEWIRGFRLLFENIDPAAAEFRLVAKLRKKRNKGVIRTGGFEYNDRFCELDGRRMRFR